MAYLMQNNSDLRKIVFEQFWDVVTGIQEKWARKENTLIVNKSKNSSVQLVQYTDV